MDTPENVGKYSTENQQPVIGQNIGDHNTNTQYHIGTQNHFYSSDGKLVSPLPAERVWNVPFPHNPFFTGREDILAQLHANFHIGYTNALFRPQAINGLGGIGKTQIAVEYAHHYHQSYTAVLWVRAESQETLISSYNEIASLLKLPEREAQEQDTIIQSVKRWLHTHQGWLLLVDNADELEYLPPFLPTVIGGHLLITTRASDLSHLGVGVAHSLVVETFSPEQGTRFLLQRAGLLALDAELALAPSQDRIVAQQISQELGGLPLALDQAGAYIKATTSDLATYQQLYQQHRIRLLKERRGRDHPEPVATTWSLSFQRVEEKSLEAADLLRLCAYLSPHTIPEAILTKGTAHIGPHMVSVGADLYMFNGAIETLQAYSLLVRNSQTHSVSVHQLVQTVVRESMTTEEKKRWKQWAVLAVNEAQPNVQDVAQWNVCEQWLPHALICAYWIEQEQIQSEESTSLLYTAGYYLNDRARYAEAEPLLERVLAICEQELGAMHPNTATILNNLATLYNNQGKYATAEPLYLRALAICEQQFGTMHPSTASSLNNLAALYKYQGKYAEAEPLLERALAICEQQFGTMHPSITATLNNLAGLYEVQGKYAKVELLLKRALTIKEQYLGVMHPSTANTLNSLAVHYQGQGKDEEAEPLLERALAICEQQLGAMHPDTALSLNNLAQLYLGQGKYDAAEPLYLRTLAICEQQLGAMHPFTANALNSLAGLYEDQGKYADAEPLYLRALLIKEQQLGHEHPSTGQSLNNLAQLYLRSQNLGKYADAELLLKRALAICEQQFGTMHPDIAQSLNGLVVLYRIQGKYADAELLLKRALAICEQQFGTMHPDIAQNLNNLALFYQEDQGKYTEAEPLLKRALAIHKQHFGATHPKTAISLNNLAGLYEAQGKYQYAEPLYQYALAVYEQVLGTTHPDTQTIRRNYVSLLKILSHEET